MTTCNVSLVSSRRYLGSCKVSELPSWKICAPAAAAHHHNSQVQKSIARKHKAQNAPAFINKLPFCGRCVHRDLCKLLLPKRKDNSGQRPPKAPGTAEPRLIKVPRNMVARKTVLLNFGTWDVPATARRHRKTSFGLPSLLLVAVDMGTNSLPYSDGTLLVISRRSLCTPSGHCPGRGTLHVALTNGADLRPVRVDHLSRQHCHGVCIHKRTAPGTSTAFLSRLWRHEPVGPTRAKFIAGLHRAIGDSVAVRCGVCVQATLTSKLH